MRIFGVSDAQRLSFLAELCDELFINCLVYEDARTRFACLARIVENAIEGAGDGCIDLGIFENERRRFSTQLKGYTLERLRGRRRYAFSGYGAAGECDLVDTRMFDECLTKFAARAGQNVEHAFW